MWIAALAAIVEDGAFGQLRISRNLKEPAAASQQPVAKS
jgi:hypothetical protein